MALINTSQTLSIQPGYISCQRWILMAMRVPLQVLQNSHTLRCKLGLTDSIPAQVCASCHFICRSFICPNMKVLETCLVPHFTDIYMENTVFWVIMPCNLERARCCGRVYCFRLQGWRVGQARKDQKQVTSLGPSPNYMTLELRRPYPPQSPTVRTTNPASTDISKGCKNICITLSHFLGVTRWGLDWWMDILTTYTHHAELQAQFFCILGQHMDMWKSNLIFLNIY
jgi:hypothetical protein